MTHPTWGGRFKKPINSMMCAFNASLQFDHVLFSYDILGSQAHASMLAEQQLITPEERDCICQALDAIHTEFTQAIPIDPLCEDIHMLIEQKLIEKIGDTGKKLHTGRSRNDQVALDLRLYTRDKGEDIKNQLEALRLCLAKLAHTYQNHKMPGYTHLQQAQPITLGAYFDAYQQMITRDLSRLSDWYQRMNYSPLGAGALAGSQLPLDRALTAKMLGFNGIITNTLDAVSDRDFIVELLSLSAIIMMHLSRLCEDLIIWATQEFGFITLDDAFATGSSLMPNKKNPDVLELIRGKTGRVYGHLLGLFTVMKAQPMAYNKDLQEDKEGLFDSVNTLTACLAIITPFLEATQFNTDTMHIAAHGGYLDATHVLEQLVMQGVPFRDAHHQVGLCVAEAMEKGCSLDELIKQKP